MARATWSGFLSFGLVSIPVGLFTATSDQTLHFNQLHKGTSNRVRYKKTDEATGAELSADDIVNGFALGGGEYVVVTPEELKAAAAGKSDRIEIQDFVSLDDIDPKYFRQTYYLAPKGKGADRAYLLLLRAMRETKKVGVATVVLRDKEHLVAVRPGDGVLILETMYFGDEIRDPREELENLPAAEAVDPRELAIATQLVESLAAPWDPTNYHNTYRQRLEDLVEKKRTGNAVVVGNPTERPPSNVVDLMSALRASIERSGERRRGEANAAARPARERARPAASAAASASELQARTKDELLQLCARAGVTASKKMTKAELVEALRQNSPSAKRVRRRVS